MKKLLLLMVLLVTGLTGLRAQVLVSGDISTNTTWTKNNTYLLNGFVYVTNGATLTIEAGTTIKGDRNTKGTLIVTRGGKIIADGTASEPIVFTSNEASPSYGDWGGIILLGKASTNQVYNGTPGLGLIEGGIDPVKGLYGGTDDADNSGILRYVRVEYPGIAFQPNNEINGITFGAVGAGTIVDYVQVSYSGDDAYEWFGGTVNCKHLIAYRALDDDFDTDNGYSGDIQYAFSVRDPLVADVSGSNGFESDNNSAGDGTTPKTKPTFSNITIIGATGPTTSSLYKRAAHLRRNTETSIFNSLLIGDYPVGLYIDGDACAMNAINGILEVKNTQIHGPVDPLLTNATNGFDLDTWFATSGWNNATNVSNAGASLQDPYNLDTPNPQPTGTSSALGAAAFTSTRIDKPFFEKVTYIGAFGGGGAASDWSCGWAKYKDRNTACLVETNDVAKYISAVKLFPSVANNQATLQVTLVENTDLNVEIYNLNGQFLGQQVNERAFAGEQSYTINTSNLAEGFFLVRIQAGNAVTTEKLIVIR